MLEGLIQGRQESQEISLAVFLVALGASLCSCYDQGVLSPGANTTSSHSPRHVKSCPQIQISHWHFFPTVSVNWCMLFS